MFRYFFVFLVFCLMLAGTAKAEFPIFPLWHPQTTGTTMTEYVYIPVAGPSIRWAEHAGFTIVLDDSRVYDNWTGKDQAPQVRLSLTNPAELAHLQDQDFVATVQVALEADRGCKYHAGLCVTLEDGTTMVWGPHGSGVVGDPGTDLRFRQPDGVNHLQSYGKTTVLLKLKRRYLTSPRRDVYSAWFSEDGHLWEKAAETTIDSADANEPVHVGVMLKNWGDTPHEELVTFKHFDITHVDNEPASYADNVQYSLTDANAPMFKYNLSGIEILFRVMVRRAVVGGPNPANVKLYVIHGSGTEPDDPSDLDGPKHYGARQDFDRITDRLRETGYGYNDENLIVIGPRFLRGEHPYPDRMAFQYQNLQGEEDWILIDLHEDYVRERFPADSPGMDDTFLILGHSGGGQYVTRFSMAHADKLEMAVASSPASTAYPTDKYAWPYGTYLPADFRNSNPRFSIDLVSALGLPMAVVMGECDVLLGGGDEVNRYTMNVAGYSRQDNARKWVRQMVSPTHEVFICPKNGHGYELEKQILSLIYLFGDATDSVEDPADPVGDPADWATMDQWKYTYSLGLQDQEYDVSPLLLLTLWADRIHYFKFERYSRPAGEAGARYQFWPDSNICTVWDGKGNPIGAGTYTLTQGMETFELEVYDGTIWETFRSPKMHYGKLRFYSDDYMLQESAAVTPVFIDEQVVGRRLNLYTCTDRYPSGPVAGDIAVGPFPEDTIILNADGSVTDVDTGLPPTVLTMRYWYYHTHRNLLYFMNEACRNDLVFLQNPDPDNPCLNKLRLGEWRWGHDAMGDIFLAAMHTRDEHDVYRKELQTNAIYNPRYFEEWDSAGLDFDNDGYTDILDNCPVTANTDQTDRDADGLGDACDPLYNPHVPNRYVCSDGYCGGMKPCYKTIAKAVEAASTGTLIKIAAEKHDGDFSLIVDKDLMLQGGWDKTFNNPSGGTTTLKGAPKAPRGSLLFQNLKIVP